MMFIRFNRVLGGILAGGFLLSASMWAQSAAAPPTNAARPRPHSRYQPNRFSKRANLYYTQIWGIDSLSVKLVESGELVRFTYRVLDPAKAKMLNDKRFAPSLIDPQARVKLVVPSMEKVGQLRQATTPESGRMYWMAFSNKGRPVKPGHHVDVVIGKFHADGLLVE